MSADARANMRLKLTVRRHSLPPTRVLWTAGSFPPYTATGSSGIISQLLEQINEVIPLESDEWGLEDYAVEVGGFECLHFSDLNQVLKEDDEVWWVSSFQALERMILSVRIAYGPYKLPIFDFGEYPVDIKSPLTVGISLMASLSAALFYGELRGLP